MKNNYYLKQWKRCCVWLLLLLPYFSLAQSLSVTLATKNPTCSNTTEGQIVATPSGGKSPYTYKWSDNTTGQGVYGINAGSYSVTVTDADRNTATASATITAPAPITIGISFANVCTNPTTTATANGGTAPYTYQWSNGATGNVQNLPAGGYYLKVTDSKGCEEGRFVIVPNAISVSLVVTGLRCFGDCDASIKTVVQGGTAPFKYEWNTGYTASDILAGVPSGTYSVKVTDANGCVVNASVTVENPTPITIGTTVVKPACGTNNCNGSVTVTPSGGKSPYTYDWSNGQTTATVNNLCVGDYEVTVTDANGCKKNFKIAIPSGADFTVAVNATNATCGATNGSAKAVVTGGTAPFTYKWSSGQTTQNITGIGAGTYTVTVTDAKGCTNTGSAVVNASGGLTVAVTKQDAQCGISNGVVTANVSGGTPPFIYKWSNDSTTAMVKGLDKGTYTVTVTDASGCTAIGSATISQTASFDVAVQTQNIPCFGGATGVLTAMMTGGSAPYSFTWSNGATTQIVNNVSAGTYSVSVTDANGCTATNTGTVTQPTSALNLSLIATNTNCGGTNGAISSTVSGGTAPYTYRWSNSATTANLTNLIAGDYTLTVTDANNCTIVRTATVGVSNRPQVTVSTQNTSCGATNGSATATPSGGISPYTYLWSNGVTTQTISNLAAGNYTVTITDAAGCTATALGVVNSSSNISVSISITNVNCNGNSTGTALANVTGGTGTYTYKWSNNATTNAINNLVAGNYSLTVTDGAGCTAISNFTISQPALLSVIFTNNNTTCNFSNGTASANVSGGTIPYSYLWSNGATTQSLSNLAAGTYALTVTDANACTRMGSVTIEPSVNVNVIANVTKLACAGFSNGSVTATPSLGTAPFTFEWSSGATTQTATNLAAGIYSVTVTDAKGCKASASVTLTNSSAITVTIDKTNVLCKGGNTGSATANPSGGIAPYTYRWSNSATTQVINNLATGTYTVTVTGANDCTAVGTVTITEPSAILACSVTILQQNTINGGSDGQLRSDPTGGTSPYVYRWSNGATTQAVNNLRAGNYSVTVTDFNGCTTTCNATITEPPCDNVTDPGTIGYDEEFCPPNAPQGIVEITPATGGTGDLEYMWMRSILNTSNFQDGNWYPIPNEYGKDLLNLGTITRTTYFVRCVRRKGCGLFKESNVVVKTPTAFAGLADGKCCNSLSTCLNNDAYFEALNSGAGATYTWNFGSDATPSTFTGKSVTVRFSTTGIRKIRLDVTRNGCSATFIFDFNVDNCVAPVIGSFMGFSAKAMPENVVQLNWQTQQENLESEYTVQRSADGTQYDMIGNFKSLNRSQSTYSFTDRTPKMGHVYYRIVNRGTYTNQTEFSKVEHLVLMQNANDRLMVYPNPVNNLFYIELLDKPMAQNGAIDIYNEMGIRLRSIVFNKNNLRQEIDLSDFAKGVYLLRVRYDDNSETTTKIVKQ